MFESLSEKLQETFRNITGRGTLSEKNIEDAIHDVRMALLEADVNYKIVKEFGGTKERCQGSNPYADRKGVNLKIDARKLKKFDKKVYFSYQFH